MTPFRQHLPPPKVPPTSLLCFRAGHRSFSCGTDARARRDVPAEPGRGQGERSLWVAAAEGGRLSCPEQAGSGDRNLAPPPPSCPGPRPGPGPQEGPLGSTLGPVQHMETVTLGDQPGERSRTTPCPHGQSRSAALGDGHHGQCSASWMAPGPFPPGTPRPEAARAQRSPPELCRGASSSLRAGRSSTTGQRGAPGPGPFSPRPPPGRRPPGGVLGPRQREPPAPRPPHRVHRRPRAPAGPSPCPLPGTDAGVRPPATGCQALKNRALSAAARLNARVFRETGNFCA